MDRGGQQPDLSVGIRALAVLVPLFAVALAVYSVRIWTRIRPKNRLNAADHAITVAFVRAPDPLLGFILLTLV